ncbi:putative NACHT domain containing protein [Lyophyllum shimeji]|uniref:NACHT domain containing protein n=1 Tax=Lyophyllum shimeji TaxID=47721 RepID=A0A9P3PMQ8_LYOSH|nr:putative NACHT domain containing protein [Lyophyllum shimeji]
MSFFANAHKPRIDGGSFTNVQGDTNNYQAGRDITVQVGDPVLHTLLPMTATGAAYDSEERYPPPKCHPNTRQAILTQIKAWRESEGTAAGGSVMWLHGPAGAGKSAIAQTICESSAGQGTLVASFFFSRGHPRRSTIELFFTTIAFQLAMLVPNLRDQIAQVVSNNPLLVHGASTAIQVENLIAGPLRSMAFTLRRPFLIVVDGVDECAGNDNQTRLLTNLIDLVYKHQLSLHILVVSRPEPHIKGVFSRASTQGCQIVSLCGDHQADADIRAFLEDGFEAIHDAERHSYIMKHVPKPWPADHVLDNLLWKSAGYFIYASTVLRFVDAEYFSPLDRLNEVANSSPTSPTTAFAELDKLYSHILSSSPNISLMKSILGCILVPLNTLRRAGPSLAMIETVFGLSQGMAMLTLRGLHSIFSFEIMDHPHFLTKEEPGQLFVRSLHASFADFVFDCERAGIFFVDEQAHHADMARRCWTHFANWLELEPHITASVRRYLLQSFHFHFTRIRDKRPLLDSLTTADSATWTPIVRASIEWPTDDKVDLIVAIDDVAAVLKAHGATRPDQIMELNALVDFAYRSHLSPQSEGDRKFIQMIYNMFAQFSPNTTLPDRLGAMRWDAMSELVDFLQLSQHAESYWEDIEAYMNAFSGRRRIGPPLHVARDRNCRRRSFVDFMSDARRCGDLYIEAGISHARLAICCMNVLRTWSVSRGPAYT